MRTVGLIAAAAILAGCGQESSSSSASSPGWNPIPGGKEVRWAGVAADVPGSWTTIPQGDVTVLVPPGANQTALDEIYSFMGAPTLKSLDTPGLEPYLDQALLQLLQVPVRRQGEAKRMKLGALDGRQWSWTAGLMDGRTVDIRSWAFEGSYVGSLVAIAAPDALKKRMPELEQILGSLRRPATAITAASLCTTWVRAFGSGTLMVGNSNEQRITFDARGRYHYHSEGTSHGVFHSGSSQTDIPGSWTLKGDQLTVTADSGESKTYTVEARTEAGTGAAVIAVDGTEFRQVEGRRW